VLVAEVAEEGAEDGAGAELTVEPPWDGYDRMTAAEPAGDDTVRVTAEVHGETERGEAWFRVDRTARRIQWGSPEHDYHGTLDLEADQDRTIVDIELHTERTADDEINQALDATLDSIQQQVEVVQ